MSGYKEYLVVICGQVVVSEWGMEEELYASFLLMKKRPTYVFFLGQERGGHG